MNDRELKALARKLDANPATLEKDYALTWLLRGFYLEKSRLREAFVMKGGTAISEMKGMGNKETTRLSRVG